MITAVDEASGVAVAVPEGWTQLPPAETGGLALAPAGWPEDYGFRPNLSVGVSAPTSPAPSIHSAGMVTAAAAATIDGSRVIAYDMWPTPRDGWGGLGRRVVFAYAAEQTCLVVTQWVLVTGERTVTVTATVDTDRYLRVTPAFMEALDGLELGAPPEATQPLENEALQPRRDEFLAELGEDVEDLSGFAEQDPWAPVGAEIGRTGLDLLVRATRRRLSTRRLGQQERDAARQLTEAGLLDNKGRLTGNGTDITEVMRRADHHVRVEAATTGMASFTFDAYSVGNRTVVLATVSPAGWTRRQPPGAEIAWQVVIEPMPTALLPLELARWLGLRPAWALATAPDTLPLATITARVDDPQIPVPDGADTRLTRVWAQPWFMWTARVTGEEDRSAAGINAGEAGTLSLTRPEELGDGDIAALQAWPSEAVWGRLVDLCLV